MWAKLRQILSMIRFSHTVFALPFALLAAVLAWSAPTRYQVAPFRWRDLLGILLCMVFARSAAMAFNRIADRHWDARNPRTSSRHLATGSLSVAGVAVFTAATSILFVASTLLFLPNFLPLALSLPVLALLLAYSYTKRFTTLAHFWLGACLMLAPVATWIALRGELLLKAPRDLWPAAWLGLAVLFWVAGFDMIYACQDAQFDRRAKLHSIPAAWGVRAALRFAAGCHLLTVLLLLGLPWIHYLGGPPLGLGGIYWTGIALVAGLLIYEHALVRPDDLSRVNVAFFQVNAIVSFGLLVVGTVDSWLF